MNVVKQLRETVFKLYHFCLTIKIFVMVFVKQIIFRVLIKFEKGRRADSLFL